MRRYAEGTTVGVSRSREQIDRILREWGARGIQWTDEFVPERTMLLRFIWEYEGIQLTARFSMRCDRQQMEKMAVDGRTGRVSPGKLEKSLAVWGNEAHRLLFLFLKGSMYAIDGGLIKAEQIFLPFFEDGDGNTIGDLMVKRLKDLPLMPAMKLLPSGQKEKR